MLKVPCSHAGGSGTRRADDRPTTIALGYFGVPPFAFECVAMDVLVRAAGLAWDVARHWDLMCAAKTQKTCSRKQPDCAPFNETIFLKHGAAVAIGHQAPPSGALLLPIPQQENETGSRCDVFARDPAPKTKDERHRQQTAPWRKVLLNVGVSRPRPLYQPLYSRGIVWRVWRFLFTATVPDDGRNVPIAPLEIIDPANKTASAAASAF